MTENSDTPTTASQETAERTSSNESPRSQTNAAVTLKAVPFSEEDEESVRRVLPSADVRVEVVGHRFDRDCGWVDMIRPVFRCTYSSLPPGTRRKTALGAGCADARGRHNGSRRGATRAPGLSSHPFLLASGSLDSF